VAFVATLFTFPHQADWRNVLAEEPSGRVREDMAWSFALRGKTTLESAHLEVRRLAPLTTPSAMVYWGRYGETGAQPLGRVADRGVYRFALDSVQLASSPHVFSIADPLKRRTLITIQISDQ
jgi:hypothetical protein